MHKVMTMKDGKHGLAYGFLLNREFVYIDVDYGSGKDGSSKQMFNLPTLKQNECIYHQIEVKSKLVVADLIEV